MNEYIQQNIEQNFYQCLQIFRVIVVDTQSETFGIKLVDDNARQLIQQFNNYVIERFNKLGGQFEDANQLWAGELLRFGFDFYEFLE